MWGKEEGCRAWVKGIPMGPTKRSGGPDAARRHRRSDSGPPSVPAAPCRPCTSSSCRFPLAPCAPALRSLFDRLQPAWSHPCLCLCQPESCHTSPHTALPSGLAAQRQGLAWCELALPEWARPLRLPRTPAPGWYFHQEGPLSWINSTCIPRRREQGWGRRESVLSCSG